MTFPGDPHEPYQPGASQPGDPFSAGWTPAQKPQYGPPAAPVPPPISGPGYPPPQAYLPGQPMPTMPAPARKRNTKLIVLGVVVGLVVVCCGVGAVIAATSPVTGMRLGLVVTRTLAKDW